jgi:hypothetical protein
MKGAQEQVWGEKQACRRDRLLAPLGLERLGPRHIPHPQAATLAPCIAAWERQLRALPRRLRRALQRRFAVTLAELALLLTLGLVPARAATITVDGTTCTLVDAIAAANTDTAAGGCPAGGGADTLVLPAGGTITLTSVDNSTYGATGLPVVASAITITGQGSLLERSGSAPNFRLLAVGSGGNLTLWDLTISGGVTDLSGGGIFNSGALALVNSTVTGNSSTFSGGGVLNYGTLIVAHSTLSGNTASNRGGGVFNDGPTFFLTASTLSGNSAASDGGGVYSLSGTHTLTQSTLSGNTAGGRGGGVHHQSGTLMVATSTLAGNSASFGGGGLWNSSTLTVANSTLSGNTATFGGGVYNGDTLTLTASTVSGNTAGTSGGGVFNASGALTLTGSTVSGNTAGTSGGGAYNLGTLTLTASTLTGNSAGSAGGVANAGTLTLAQTVVSGNTAAAGREAYSAGGTVSADADNLFGHDGDAGVNGFSPGASDAVPSAAFSAILTPTLAFNGGPTQTHDLVLGSPAVGGVPAASCLTTDQRGLVRPQGADCDIGAVEFDAQAPPVVTTQVSFVPLSTSFSATTDTAGCPGGFAGKFFFVATLTNLAGNPPLEALKDQVLELTNGNLVQTADGGAAGVASTQTLPEVEGFSDGVLSAGESVQVPFVVCLQTLSPFRFLVDVLGLQTGP